MFSFFKRDPVARLEKEIIRKMSVSVELQRDGKIKEPETLDHDRHGQKNNQARASRHRRSDPARN